ncbi:MAG: recombinase family protein [Bdellovibrionales bacterium]|nr:recombinase family protein [Bdellovibrionales bacterium]
MAKKQPRNFNIGCYIRVSTEEQAKNLEGSIKNQQERLKNYVKSRNLNENFGEIVDIFIDRAKSGKDTNRPELQRMLKNIQKGELNLIMSTELSRISRSIKDFSEIWDLLRSYNCGFLSLRENFDSTTAAGEMMLFSMANLAQFERRQVSERVSANMNARAKRGLYNGGTVPFGYQLPPDKPGFLEIDEAQAKVVRKAFEVFLKKESLQPTARWLNENGYKLKKAMSGGGRFKRLGQFTVDNLHHILRNKIYIGVKFYEENGERLEAEAVWETIVEKEIFEKVQKVLSKNKGRKKPQSFKKHPYLISGITHCGDCESHLSGKSAHGATKKIPYYEHSWATKRGAALSKELLECSGRKRYSATKLEELVVGEVKKLITSPKFAKSLLEKAKEVHEGSKAIKEEENLKQKLFGFNSQLDALAERLSELPKSVSAVPIYKQMERIEEEKSGVQKTLKDLKIRGVSSKEPPIELSKFSKFLESLKTILNSDDHELRSKIIKRLVHKVIPSENEVEIQFKVCESSLLREPIDLGSRLFLCPKRGQVLKLGIKKGDPKSPPLSPNHLSNFAPRNSSQTLTNGAPGET